MYPENILKTGAKFNKMFLPRTAAKKLSVMKSACPTKIFYLWEKHGVRRVELFSLE